MEELLDPLLVAWLGSAALMLVLWVLQVRIRDAGLVDVGWAASLAAMAVGYALTADGAPVQRLLAGGLGGLWGSRLAWHLLRDRVIGAEREDGRYAALREHWGARADLHFAWFFQVQALLAAILSLPFLLVSRTTLTIVTPVQWAGVALFAVSIAGEAIADRQLARFRRRSDNRGRTCREGLWRYSRHPNYFFEWLIWCAFAAIAWPAPHGPFALAMPVLMYVLVTRVTGIPYTEAHALRSRGADYERYQRTTSRFFPWPPREDARAGGLPS